MWDAATAYSVLALAIEAASWDGFVRVKALDCSEIALALGLMMKIFRE